MCGRPVGDTIRLEWNDFRRCDSEWISFPVLDSIRETGLPPECKNESSECRFCFLNLQCKHSASAKVRAGKMKTACVKCLDDLVFREVWNAEKEEFERGHLEFRPDASRKVHGEFFCCCADVKIRGQMLDPSKSQRFRVTYACSGYVPSMWSSVKDPLRMQMTR